MSNDYISLLDIVSALFWLIVILVIGIIIRSSNEDKPHYKYYLPNLYAKLFFSLGFAVFYAIYIQGGDTLAYFEGAVKMNNLFLKSPTMYFEQMFTTPTRETMTHFFDSQTGFPPGWIYREPEAFFVCKMLSLFSFLSMNSFFALTFMIAFITASASWKFFEFVRGLNLVKDNYLVIGILLFPSVNFWCSGISKDTVIYISLLMMTYHGFKLTQSKENMTRHIFWVLFFGFLTYHVRSFLLITVILPFIFAVSTRVVRRFGGKDFAVISTQTLILVAGFALMTISLSSQSEEELIESNALIQEASIVQRDFENNASYGTNRYSIGEIEYTFTGLLQATPAAILAGIYRPFIWESLNPTLLMNGLESLLLFFLTIRFFTGDLRNKYRKIRTDEFLVFSLSFILFLAFITGLTSGLFGVLVRLRAPILPFLIILLSLDLKSFNENKTEAVGEIP